MTKKILDPDLCHGEDGAIERRVEFPYHDVAADLHENFVGGDGLEDELSPEEWDRFKAPLEKLFRWIYQDPHHRNLNGLQIRVMIVAWLVVKELQPLSLTELARMLGKDKQSVGRWVEDFKKRFEGVRNCHMRG